MAASAASLFLAPWASQKQYQWRRRPRGHPVTVSPRHLSRRVFALESPLGSKIAYVGSLAQPVPIRRPGSIYASSAVVPPSASPASPAPSASDVVWPALGAFLAMGAMSAVDKFVEPMGLTFTIAPFGAVCAVLFSAPNTPAAKKYNMFIAHVGCAAIGVAALTLFGPGWLARGVSLAASLAFMQCTGSLHPPAAGLPLLFIDAPKFQRLQWWYVIFPSAVGCILLCLLVEYAIACIKMMFFSKDLPQISNCEQQLSLTELVTIGNQLLSLSSSPKQPFSPFEWQILPSGSLAYPFFSAIFSTIKVNTSSSSEKLTVLANNYIG